MTPEFELTESIRMALEERIEPDCTHRCGLIELTNDFEGEKVLEGLSLAEKHSEDCSEFLRRVPDLFADSPLEKYAYILKIGLAHEEFGP